MAKLYKFVLFKESEYYKEIMKCKNVLSIRKIVNEHSASEYITEKGLILAKLNFNKPMIVSFANKMV
jgi:hypothetical protein